jgi:hypothetical protein
MYNAAGPLAASAGRCALGRGDGRLKGAFLAGCATLGGPSDAHRYIPERGFIDVGPERHSAVLAAKPQQVAACNESCGQPIFVKWVPSRGKNDLRQFGPLPQRRRRGLCRSARVPDWNKAGSRPARTTVNRQNAAIDAAIDTTCQL